MLNGFIASCEERLSRLAALVVASEGFLGDNNPFVPVHRFGIELCRQTIGGLGLSHYNAGGLSWLVGRHR
jgi:hypothetical protein